MQATSLSYLADISTGQGILIVILVLAAILVLVILALAATCSTCGSRPG